MWYRLLFFGSLACAMALELPKYMKACSRSDPNLNECALKSARAALHQFSLGDPNRDLKPLDPLYVAEMTVYIPNKQGFRLIFKDSYFKGLSDLKMESLKFDMENKVIIAEAMVTLEVTNTYDLSGRFMVIPIKSNGDSQFNLRNTRLRIRYWYEDAEGDDGKIHWKINKHDVKYQVEKASFRLDNLLNDKNIGDQINKVLNDMWREIVGQVGPTICHAMSGAVVENWKVLLGQVPVDELFLD